MDSQEIRDKIMAAINGLIKDEPQTADANLHDVLAAKMRSRIDPVTGVVTDVDPEPTDADPDADPDNVLDPEDKTPTEE